MFVLHAAGGRWRFTRIVIAVAFFFCLLLRKVVLFPP